MRLEGRGWKDLVDDSFISQSNELLCLQLFLLLLLFFTQKNDFCFVYKMTALWPKGAREEEV